MEQGKTDSLDRPVESTALLFTQSSGRAKHSAQVILALCRQAFFSMKKLDTPEKERERERERQSCSMAKFCLGANLLLLGRELSDPNE